MFAKRLDNLRQQLKDHEVDCVALVPGFNFRYLTGLDFHFMERAFIAFVPAEGDPVLALPGLEVSKWEGKAPFDASLFPWDDKDGPHEAMRQAVGALPEIHSLAVEHLRMRVMEHTLVRRFLPNATIGEAESLLDPLRLRKDEAEVAALRRAIEITEAALEDVISGVKPGMTEQEIAGRLMIALMDGGGEALPFQPIVLSGWKSALPHGIPDERPVEAGELLLIDSGTTVGGYNSDMTRTFVVGQEPDGLTRARYEAVQAANEAGRQAARPGVALQDVDRAARQAIVDAGFGELFTHRTGHGLGLDVHEPPWVVEGNETELVEGMVFTVEPGVYDEAWGGIRIEDNVVVTADGAESLTTFGRDLRVV